VRSGAIMSVILAMRNQPSRLDIQEAGCAALLSLSAHTARGKRLVVKQGGMECLVLALQQHSHCLSLINEACRLISQVAIDAPIMFTMLKVNVCETLILLINKYSKNEGFAFLACQALARVGHANRGVGFNKKSELANILSTQKSQLFPDVLAVTRLCATQHLKHPGIQQAVSDCHTAWSS